MPIILWGVLAILAGIGVLWIAARRAMPKMPPLPADVELPTTPMQRTARWSLLGGLVLAVAAAGVIIGYGPMYTYDTDHVRIMFMLLVLGAIAVPALATVQLHYRAKSAQTTMDERDLTILQKAPAIQAGATLVTMAVWVVGLTEQFRDAGGVPTFYLQLMFWCCLMIYAIGLPVGILVGYRRR